MHIKGLHIIIKMAEDVINASNPRIAELEAELRNAKDEIARLTANLESAQQTIQEFQPEIKRINSENTTLKEEIANTKSAAEKSLRIVQELTTQNKILNETKTPEAAETAEVLRLRGVIADIKLEKDQFEQKNNKNRYDALTATQKVKKLEAEIAAFKVGGTTISPKTDELKMEIALLKAQIETMKEAPGSNEDKDQKIRELSNKIRENISENGRLTSQVSLLESMLAAEKKKANKPAPKPIPYSSYKPVPADDPAGLTKLIEQQTEEIRNLKKQLDAILSPQKKPDDYKSDNARLRLIISKIEAENLQFSKTISEINKELKDTKISLKNYTDAANLALSNAAASLPDLSKFDSQEDLIKRLIHTDEMLKTSVSLNQVARKELAVEKQKVIQLNQDIKMSQEKTPTASLEQDSTFNYQDCQVCYAGFKTAIKRYYTALNKILAANTTAATNLYRRAGEVLGLSQQFVDDYNPINKKYLILAALSHILFQDFHSSEFKYPADQVFNTIAKDATARATAIEPFRSRNALTALEEFPFYCQWYNDCHSRLDEFFQDHIDYDITEIVMMLKSTYMLHELCFSFVVAPKIIWRVPNSTNNQCCQSFYREWELREEGDEARYKDAKIDFMIMPGFTYSEIIKPCTVAFSEP